MADQTTTTVEDYLKAAFQALLRGDTAERDILCALIERTYAEHGVVELDADTPVEFNSKHGH